MRPCVPLVRIQPSAGRVRPYTEGLLGFSYVYTRTSIDLGDEGGGAATTHLGDFAPSCRGGGRGSRTRDTLFFKFMMAKDFWR